MASDLPPLYTEAGLEARLAPAVFTLLELHSCYAYFWTGASGDRMRIRAKRGNAASDNFVDIPECHWDNIEAWKDAINLCCEQSRSSTRYPK